MRLLFSQPPSSGLRPAIFLDRDGVINERITDGYVRRWSEFRFVPGIIDALAMLSETPVPIIVVSNQAGVEKGLIKRSDLMELTERFVDCLRQASARIDAVYYCPHTPEEACSCRKPQAGLLLRAAQDWRIDLCNSVFVGDSVTDAEAAHAVDCGAILFDRTASLGVTARTITVNHVSQIASCVRACLSAASIMITGETRPGSFLATEGAS